MKHHLKPCCLPDNTSKAVAVWVGVVSKNTTMCWKWQDAIFSTCYFFTIDIFSMYCSWQHCQHVLFWWHFQYVLFWQHFQHKQLSFFNTEPSDWSSRLHFQHSAIWFVLPTTFSAFWLEQFQHRHLWLAGNFVIFSTEHFRWLAFIAMHHNNTGCIQQQEWYLPTGNI